MPRAEFDPGCLSEYLLEFDTRSKPLGHYDRFLETVINQSFTFIKLVDKIIECSTKKKIFFLHFSMERVISFTLIFYEIQNIR